MADSQTDQNTNGSFSHIANRKVNDVSKKKPDTYLCAFFRGCAVIQNLSLWLHGVLLRIT